MGRKQGNKGGGYPGLGEHEEKQQAVVLADTFSENFEPVSSDLPIALYPLITAPMIDYVLELLASNGVEEVFVFCARHADKVTQYVESSQWGQQMDVKILTNSYCQSAGDALREIDCMDIIRSDPFVLISDGVISNINLRRVIAKHKKAKKVDPMRVMTMCFKEADPLSSLRPVLDELVIGLDSETEQVLLFEDNLNTRSLSIPIQLLCDGNEISMDLRNDLIDCGIDICSPEVLLLMSDNFDYQNLRSHFVANEVDNIELGNKIMAHVMDNDEYGMRVSDFRTYAAASRDIMLRWMYPMVPENIPGPLGMCYERNSIYRHHSVTLPRSTYIGRCSTICCNAKVGENCRVEGSVLGIGTVLEEGCNVTNSFLWGGAVVGKGASIDRAVVAEDVVIGNGVTVSRGCVLGKGAIVEPGATLPSFTRLSNTPDVSVKVPRRRSISDEEAEPDLLDVNSLICQSIGCIDEETWKKSRWSEYLDEEEILDLETTDNGRFLSSEDGDIPNTSLSMCSSAETHLQQEEGFYSSYHPQEVRLGNTAVCSDPNFHLVVKDLLVKGHADSHPPEYLLLEVKSYKFAQNSEFSACAAAAIDAVLHVAWPDEERGQEMPSSDSMGIVSSIKEVIQEWKILLSALGYSNKEELAMVYQVERMATGLPTLGQIFPYILQLLYHMDVVSEETLLEWAEERYLLATAANVTESDGALLALFDDPKTQEFITWLKEEDEEEESDDE